MEQERKRILRKALSLFFKKGYSRVTTQEISSALGISKKTLYLHFPSKKEIALEALSANLEGVGRRMDMILDNGSYDFGERFVRFLALVNHQIRNIGDLFIEDIHRSLPEAWEMIDAFRRNRVPGLLHRLLTEGRNQGFVRDDVEIEEIVFLVSGFINGVLIPERLVETGVSLHQIFTSFIEMLYGGILSLGGRDALAGKKNRIKLEELYDGKELWID